MICQIILVGMDQSKLERGIVELGANKIIIFTPNHDKYYAIARSIVKKYDQIAETEVVPILDDEAFTFTHTFKRIISENFRKYEIKINASTDVRNWKVLSFFSITQFLPYLQEISDNRIMYYEVIGGPSTELDAYEYKKVLSEDELIDLHRDDEMQPVEADKVDSKQVLKTDVTYYDDLWGNPEKRPPAHIEVYPIETLTNLEQYIVDIISRQELTIEQIKGEYSIIADKYVTDGLLSRYLGGLKRKAIIMEKRDGRSKLFYLTDYGLKYVLPIIKEGSGSSVDPYANVDIPPWERAK